MNARMSKYSTESGTKRRTQKNEKLYSELGNMNIDYVDIDVDNAVELSSSAYGRTSREDYQKQRELNKILPSNRERVNKEPEYVEPKEDRVYDINEILKMARQNKLFENSDKKRLINTEYNILTKLDVASLENEEMKKEDLRSLIDDIYEKEEPKEEKKVYSRTAEEKLLKDLFDDEPEEEISLEEELSSKILDKEEHKEEKQEEVNEKEPEEEIATQITEDNPVVDEDNSGMFDFGIEKKPRKERKKSKKEPVNMLKGIDFEEERRKSKELEEEAFEEEKEGKGLVIAIIIVVILILFTCGFFVYEYFFGL